MKEEIRMEIECRTDEDRLGPGRIVGTLMTYGKQARDRREVFEVGSLKWDGPLILNRMHTRASPIMRVTPIVDGNEVKINEQIPDSTAGRDCAAEIRSGLLRGMSIEFRATAQNIVGGVRRITAAVLSGAAIVDSPSYAGSSVEVRAKGGGNRPNEETLWL